MLLLSLIVEHLKVEVWLTTDGTMFLPNSVKLCYSDKKLELGTQSESMVTSYISFLSFGKGRHASGAGKVYCLSAPILQRCSPHHVTLVIVELSYEVIVEQECAPAMSLGNCSSNAA
jgi:hypothetical protein